IEEPIRIGQLLRLIGCRDRRLLAGATLRGWRRRHRRRLLPHAFLRLLVRADPLECRMAQLPVRSPLGEAHLRDQARLDPVSSAQPWSAARRRVWPLVLRQLLLQFGALLRGEAGPHLPRELVTALPVRHREQQRTERTSGVPVPRSPPDDRQLLRRLCFELQPLARAPLLVYRSARLQDQAFQPTL